MKSTLESINENLLKCVPKKYHTWELDCGNLHDVLDKKLKRLPFVVAFQHYTTDLKKKRYSIEQIQILVSESKGKYPYELKVI